PGRRRPHRPDRVPGRRQGGRRDARAHARTRPRADGRARRAPRRRPRADHRRLMLHAAWKSLLGRKLRLIMSTFAIVLGVAFVVGTLIFTDTLNRSFVAIFDNSVGDVVVQPTRVTSNVDVATTVQLRGSLVDDIAQLDGVRRADGKVVAAGVFVVGKNNKVIGGQGPPGFAFNDN